MTERSGFFSKLFGRSTILPSTDSVNASSSPSSSANTSGTNGGDVSTANCTKSLRYLSPTAIESSFTQSSFTAFSATPSADPAPRKRLADNEYEHTPSMLNGRFQVGDAAKRFRSSFMNQSLVSEPSSRLELPRVDTTWTAGMDLNSPSLTHSPSSSVRSLRSRITRPSSRASVLSSKTAALLEQIEKVSTPAQEARRLPMLRVGISKERWAPMATSPSVTAPPLTRLSTAPSRYQVISSFLPPANKKPYWKDVSRESAKRNEREDVISIPTVDLTRRNERGEEKEKKNGEERRNGVNGGGESVHANQRQSTVLKGSDGSNRYSAKEVIQETDEVDGDTAWMEKAKGLNQFTFALPTKGFLAKSDTAPFFSFAKPVKATEIVEDSDSGDESGSDDSGSSESESEERGKETIEDKGSTGKTSDTSSSAENTSEEKADASKEDEAKKNPVSTPKISITPALTEPVKKAASSTWSCPDCFVSNEGDKCACCGYSNVKTPSSQAPPPPSTPWDCSECFVSNKATDAKCVACSNPRPGTAPSSSSSSSSNVFGDKAFKPTNFATSTTAKVSFGLGSSTSISDPPKPSTPSTGEFSFGLGSSAVSKPSLPSSTPSFGLSSSIPSTSTSFTAPLSFGLPSSSSTTTTTPFPVPSSLPSTLPSFPSSLPSATPSLPLFGLPSSSSSTVPSTSSTVPSTTASAPSATPFSFPTTSTFGGFGLKPSVASTVLAAPIATPATTTSTLAQSSTLFGATTIVPSSTILGWSSQSAASSAPSTLPSAPSAHLFSSSSSKPLFGTSSTTPLFGASSTSASSTGLNLFGSTPATSLVASSSNATPTLSFTFGSSKPAETESAKPSLFSIGGTSTTSAAPLFGAFNGKHSKEDAGPEAKKAFGAGTGGLFGQTTAATDNPSPFAQSASSPNLASFTAPSAVPTSFNFGSAGGAPPSEFKFGSSAPQAPSAAPFQFGSINAAPAFGSSSLAPAAPVDPSQPAGSNFFAFNSGAAGGRKIQHAKRRLVNKK